MKKNLLLKTRESLASVLPITAIVLLLALTVIPMEVGTLGLFLVGAVMLILGMGIFTLGADIAMMPMGNYVGAYISKSRKLKMMVITAFLMGVLITIAEPDLQVLAKQVAAVPSWLLIGSIALGVGFFLVISLLRVVFEISLSKLFIVCYIIVFALATLTKPEYLAVAFDSGGVTTGPISTPFILAFGVGIASVRSGKDAEDDSFGLVGLCSCGPILAVIIMGIFYPGKDMTVAANVILNPSTGPEILKSFTSALPHYMLEVLLAVSPIVVVFSFFQARYLKLPKGELLRIAVGLLYTFLGLVLFLTGVNVGFLPAGAYLGEAIGATSVKWLLVPLGIAMGAFVVVAEPAVHVLNNQVEAVTGGAVSKRAMTLSLSIGVGASVGLSMLRILLQFSIWWLLVPGYILALGLTFFVPKVFTAIAFDSGGVASGPMTATFMLPFAMGACAAVGGNILTDAFGIVAMVAMTPLITIQGLGLIYAIKTRRLEKAALANAPVEDDDDQVIDL